MEVVTNGSPFASSLRSMQMRVLPNLFDRGCGFRVSMLAHIEGGGSATVRTRNSTSELTGDRRDSARYLETEHGQRGREPVPRTNKSFDGAVENILNIALHPNQMYA